MSNRTSHSRPVREKGAALLVFVVLFLMISFAIVFAIARSAYHDLATYRILSASKQTFFGADAGIEDAVYRLRRSKGFATTENFSIGNTSMQSTLVTGVDTFEVTVIASTSNLYRTRRVELALGDGASFNFGLQASTGGITLSNNSKVYGNVYSNGSVIGQGNATVFGEIVSAGPTGLVQSIHATGSVWAHTIDDADIDRDAYYYATSTITASVVGGTRYPGYPDQATTSLPLSDDVEGWKQGIEDTGTVIPSTDARCAGGTYIISSDISLGNVKIECNVEVKKTGASTVLTLTGPIWVSGNLSFSSGPEIRVSASIGARSVPIVVDNESNRLTSSKIFVNQATQFYGSGNPKSYIFVLSNNTSAELGGTEAAITLAQSANGDVLFYAGHGLADLGNSISLKEITAYQIDVNNGAEIIYETGLVSLLFTAGPGGGLTLTKWLEVE